MHNYLLFSYHKNLTMVRQQTRLNQPPCRGAETSRENSGKQRKAINPREKESPEQNKNSGYRDDGFTQQLSKTTNKDIKFNADFRALQGGMSQPFLGVDDQSHILECLPCLPVPLSTFFSPPNVMTQSACTLGISTSMLILEHSKPDFKFVF